MIREATKEDVPAIVTLLTEVLQEFGLRFGEGSETDEQVRGLPESYTNGCFWIAEEAGTLIGTCGMLALDDDGTYELRKMYLHTAARGKGTGKQLFTAAITWAKQHGARRIVLDTTSKMTRAIAFYEANGFVRDDKWIRGARCNRGYALTVT